MCTRPTLVIAANFLTFMVIVTVPLDAGDEVEMILRKERADADFAALSNLEFPREGAAIADLKRPDRRHRPASPPVPRATVRCARPCRSRRLPERKL
jgi:hypothetical protein